MISAGNHKAKAIAGTFGGKVGEEQVEVKFEIVDGTDAGQTLSWFGFFYGSDATKAASNAKRATESLLHAGWDGEFTEELRFAGAEVTLVIEHEPVVKDGKAVLDDAGEPKKRARVRWVNALGGGLVMKDRIDRSGLAVFRKRMQGIVVEAKKRITPAAPTNGTRDGGGGSSRGLQDPGYDRGPDNDEIPF